MSNDHEVLLFLPGLFDDRHMWAHQTEHLADVCTPCAIDLVEPASITQAADLVIEKAPASFGLVGFSMGGYVAFEVMRRVPERVSRLALISTSARADTADRIVHREAQIGRAATGGYAALVDEVYPLVVHASRIEDRSLKVTLRSMALRVGPDAFARQQHTIMSRSDCRGDLADISCPTMIICGRQDALTPPALSEEMARAIPGASLQLIEECGHYAPLERPRAVIAVLRQWLDSA